MNSTTGRFGGKFAPRNNKMPQESTLSNVSASLQTTKNRRPATAFTRQQRNPDQPTHTPQGVAGREIREAHHTPNSGEEGVAATAGGDSSSSTRTVRIRRLSFGASPNTAPSSPRRRRRSSSSSNNSKLSMKGCSPPAPLMEAATAGGGPVTLEALQRAVIQVDDVTATNHMMLNMEIKDLQREIKSIKTGQQELRACLAEMCRVLEHSPGVVGRGSALSVSPVAFRQANDDTPH